MPTISNCAGVSASRAAECRDLDLGPRTLLDEDTRLLWSWRRAEVTTALRLH